ncbi:hypothetical protein EIM50_20015 [Pseudoxanthomonas sp. SGD-10]|nr:hypothetical protein EIM50_20015 [Pseudoxanthomonas sp. SGD-10]
MSLSNIKITPLTIVLSFCLFYIGYLLLETEAVNNGGMSATIKALFTFILVITLFITDVLFRRFVPSMKWLWLIQSAFIILIIVLILIFQKI